MNGVGAPACLVSSDGRLAPAAIDVLHAFSGVPPNLLHQARIRRSTENWLCAPWYTYRRGGALTIGRVIWLTRRYFHPTGEGDGSPSATWNWVRILAHEAGHLPQAERFGLGPIGILRYVLHFSWQYAKRAILLQRPVHDGVPLEIEADMGRQVAMGLMGGDPATHPLIIALHAQDDQAVAHWLQAHREEVNALRARYRREHGS